MFKDTLSGCALRIDAWQLVRATTAENQNGVVSHGDLRTV
jgi:hypothetical protein